MTAKTDTVNGNIKFESREEFEHHLAQKAREFEERVHTEHQRGHRLLARIRKSSKYHGQTPDGVLFPVYIGGSFHYCVQGGPGGQYRLADVDIFAIAHGGENVQITFAAN